MDLYLPTVSNSQHTLPLSPTPLRAIAANCYRVQNLIDRKSALTNSKGVNTHFTSPHREILGGFTPSPCAFSLILAPPASPLTHQRLPTVVHPVHPSRKWNVLAVAKLDPPFSSLFYSTTVLKTIVADSQCSLPSRLTQLFQLLARFWYHHHRIALWYSSPCNEKAARSTGAGTRDLLAVTVGLGVSPTSCSREAALVQGMANSGTPPVHQGNRAHSAHFSRLISQNKQDMRYHPAYKIPRSPKQNLLVRGTPRDNFGA